MDHSVQFSLPIFKKHEQNSEQVQGQQVKMISNLRVCLERKGKILVLFC